jgi:hypothetical protein
MMKKNEPLTEKESGQGNSFSFTSQTNDKKKGCDNNEDS